MEEEAVETTGGRGAPILESGVDPEMMFSVAGDVARVTRLVAAARGGGGGGGGGVEMEVAVGELKCMRWVLCQRIKPMLPD